MESMDIHYSPIEWLAQPINQYTAPLEKERASLWAEKGPVNHCGIINSQGITRAID